MERIGPSPETGATLNGGVGGTVVVTGNGHCNWGGAYVRFVHNGGTFDYSGSGFSAISADWADNGGTVYNSAVVMNSGTFNASADWAVNNWIPLCFKDAASVWTLNQADGTTATWHTAITGDGDVTLNGAATLVGDKEVQGAPGGKWTVGAGFTAGLEGAASLLGGLEIGEGATATVDIAAGRSAVFTARDFTSDLTAANSITNRFNKELGGTTRGTITHDESFLFTHYDSGNRPFGNLNRSAAYAVGQFYVEPEAEGTWSFEGKCDDRVALWIDGECVMIAGSNCANVEGTKFLSAGWHSFRHIASDNSGGFGPDSTNSSNYRKWHTLGYKYGAMADYKCFNVKNLKMRPAADMGDANNTNTVLWSHYKGSSSNVTKDTYKRDDFAWDFCCITNTLDMIQWKGNSSTYMNGYTVNRYEGWFYVTPENADKSWTFHCQYDDYCALWIDGVDSGLAGADSDAPVYTVTLSRGWHSFRIQTADIGGNAGPWKTDRPAVSYKVADGEKVQFSDATLVFSVCPDGYIQGGVTLASNASLVNNVQEGAAAVYGTVMATGTGAKMSGPFKFEGATLAYANVTPRTKNLAEMLDFENAAEDMFANLGGIDVDFAFEPVTDRLVVGPAYGLTAENLDSKIDVRVTVDGEPYDKNIRAQIKDGNIEIVLRTGFVIHFR